jgi:FkbM family methyltransferase
VKEVGGIWLPDRETHFVTFGAGLTKYQLAQELVAYKSVQNTRVAVDVGANVGIFTRRFAFRFKKVLAFEPVPENLECLRENTKMLKNVGVYPFALGATNRVAQIRMLADNSGASYVCDDPKLADYGAGGSVRVVEVEMITLDSLELPTLDLIKIDVQGFERSVLQGARATLTRCKPVILIEEKETPGVPSYNKEVGELLLELGATKGPHVGADRVWRWK